MYEFGCEPHCGLLALIVTVLVIKITRRRQGSPAEWLSRGGFVYQLSVWYIEGKASTFDTALIGLSNTRPHPVPINVLAQKAPVELQFCHLYRYEQKAQQRISLSNYMVIRS